MTVPQDSPRGEPVHASVRQPAILTGAVDCVVAHQAGRERLLPLSDPDRPYQETMDGLGEGAVVLSDTGTIVYANDRLSAMTGLARSELLGSDIARLIAREDRAALGTLFAEEHGGRLVLHLTAAEGQTLPVMLSLQVGSVGPVPRRRLVITDLTEVRRAQQHLEAAYRGLQRRDAFLERAQAVLGMGTWEYDIGRDRFTVSGHIHRISGFSADHFDGRMSTVLGRVHPEDRALVSRVYQERIDGGDPEPAVYRWVRPDGDIRWVLEGTALERGSGGRPARLLGVVQDITDRRAAEEAERQRIALTVRAERLEQQVQARTAELDARNRSLRAFTSCISHDLHAPLRAVSGFAALLTAQSGDRLDSRGRHYLERIGAAGQRMADMLDSLLRLAELSQSVLDRRPLDLTHMAQDVLDELRCGEPERCVTTMIEPGMRVTADETLMRCLLENLLGNAWKFTRPRRDPRIAVTSDAEPSGKRVYRVSDNGIGFDMGQAADLFQPFRRLAHTKEFPGSGVGLASVAEIVRAHGGGVTAESTPGAGSTFTFSLSEAPT